MNLLPHELLDRLYILTDMYNSYIIEHEDDILTQEEKQNMLSLLWEQYQLVGQRISEREGK